MAHLPENVRSAIRLFAFYVGNGTVNVELLDGIDYRPALMEFGSDLERVFAIFSNVLDVDEAGLVTNFDQASWRAAQWIRSYLDPDYTVQPPFEDWEFELV
jgi:hypothetical protein